MNSFTIEIKKYKRSGILGIFPVIGIIGGLYAFANFIIRKETLLHLPLSPMAILLTQLYGMIMVLNLFGIIVATTLVYHIEFRNYAIKKMYMLPYKSSHIFSIKYFILSILLCLCIILQNTALCIIGKLFLPAGTFELDTLIKYAIYIYVTSLPVFSFMLLISSCCKNIWYTLGVGVVGFFSGMTMALSDIPLFLVNPFVLIMMPAIQSDITINIVNYYILSLIESIIFFIAGWLINRSSHYE